MLKWNLDSELSAVSSESSFPLFISQNMKYDFRLVDNKMKSRILNVKKTLFVNKYILKVLKYILVFLKYDVVIQGSTFGLMNRWAYQVSVISDGLLSEYIYSNNYFNCKKFYSVFDILPQKDFADLVINFFPIEPFSPGKRDKNIDIGLKININASIYLENFVESLKSNSISWDYNDDLNSQYIILKEPPLNNFKNLALNTIENLSEIADVNVKWAKGYDGFIYYLCLKIISEKLKED